MWNNNRPEENRTELMIQIERDRKNIKAQKRGQNTNQKVNDSNTDKTIQTKYYFVPPPSPPPPTNDSPVCGVCICCAVNVVMCILNLTMTQSQFHSIHSLTHKRHINIILYYATFESRDAENECE